MSKEISSISGVRKFSIGFFFLAAVVVMFFSFDLIHGYLMKSFSGDDPVTLGVIVPNLSFGFLIFAGVLIVVGIFFHIADKIRGD